MALLPSKSDCEYLRRRYRSEAVVSGIKQTDGTSNRRHDPSYVSPAVDPEAAEDQVVPSERDDGLCGAGFLMIDRDAMESVIRHPARGKP